MDLYQFISFCCLFVDRSILVRRFIDEETNINGVFFRQETPGENRC